MKYPLHYTSELGYCFGSLAQLVEQRTFNPLVASSNLARPTTLLLVLLIPLVLALPILLADGLLILLITKHVKRSLNERHQVGFVRF